MVTKLGMSDMGLLSLKDDNYKIYSDSTSSQIDQKIKGIIQEAKEKIRVIIDEKEDLLIKLSKALIDKETLNHMDIV